MTRRSHRAELLALAWPLILSQSFFTLQIFLDRVFLSQSDAHAVGAGMAAVMIFWTGLSLFQFTASYANTFVAQYAGAGRKQEIGPIVGQALWFALFAGVPFVALAPFAEAIVSLAGHAPELQAMEAAYFRCLCFAAPFILATSAATSFFAGRGDTRTVLLLNAVALLANGSVAWVLIFGKFGFPALGVEGAGWATLAGSAASALLALVLMLRRKHREEYRNGIGWGLDRRLLGRLLYFGVPQGVGTAMEYAAFTLFLLFIGLMSPADLSATSIACTLNLLAFMPMMGVGQAVEVIVGQRLGEDKPDDAANSTMAGLWLTLAFTAVVVWAYVFFPRQLVMPFAPSTPTPEWAEVEAKVPLLLRFVAAYCLFDSVVLVFAFALRGAGDTRFVTGATLAMAWPMMVFPSWLSWQQGWGMYVAWACASGYIILLAGVLGWRFWQGAWRSMRVIEQRVTEEPRSEGIVRSEDLTATTVR